MKRAAKVPNEMAIAKVEKQQRDLTGLANVSPGELITTALDRGASIDVIQKLLDMRDRLRAEEAESAFREALTRFQAECPVVIKKSKVMNKPEKGGGERFRFAPIDDIERATKTYRERNGLSHTFKTEIISEPFKGVRVTIFISHVLGHCETSSFEVPIDPDAFMTAPQKWLSAASFSKRVAMCNGYGIITGKEDDDTESVIDDHPEETEEQKAARKQDELVKKQKAEAIAKLNALPPDIVEGFKIIEVRGKGIWQFCNDREWDHAKIKADINRIADERAK